MNWHQLTAIFWLRWRLTRNQFARAGILNTVVTVISIIASIAVSIGTALGGLFGGAFGLAHASPLVILGVCDGIVVVFLFIWFFGVMVEIQRSQTIDIARLLHLPVSLGGVFVMNYLASLFTIGIFFFLPGMIGLCVGLLWSKGPLMLLLFPLCGSFLFLVTAWTYCLRGWLVTLMVNPRRRRNILVGMAIFFCLVGQAPNIYFNVFLRHQRNVEKELELANPAKVDRTVKKAPPGVTVNVPDFTHGIPPYWITIQNYVPVFWLPKGAMALAEGDVWPAVLGSIGAFLLGVAGLARAYRTTIRFYQGQEKTGDIKTPALSPTRAARRRNFLENKLPFVREDVAALTLAFFRSMSRAPEVKMALFTSVIMLVGLLTAVAMADFKTSGEPMQLFSATGAIALTFFGLLQQMFNYFGYDRDGFRALVLSPARRRDILFAKNLAVAPAVIVLGTCFLGLLIWTVHLPPLLIFAGICQLLTTFLLLSIVGNLTSIWVPYRVSMGSLKPTKPPAKTVFLILLIQLFFPLVMIPVFFAPLLGLIFGNLGWMPAAVADALLSLGLFAVVAAGYWLSLGDLGRMLEQREKNILLVVSQEVE